ncbi:hypothetical protein ZYGR_0AD01990 [Zygosaccharomyces rouxii]|uniref:ZYRO0G10538p n=2 Tax=Zygosaccharomyces rouxii TaxID=4956 RepID=C5E083_ZYGRC|nr:uncharacterized protein ZYRO0G10538g [Zygosaccharomyces rouxii]KAH9202512.1 hypothetical protein LQ764DRAFT_26571 [Zygosaccharomyces rouxii]GAV51016.1 hypothetical protein ZYGR_0AD01990 [Zygosaccharomyces rouxii]CAR29517.1 ZYRO0G10538p [Zygosaccharomyces rouxii]
MVDQSKSYRSRGAIAPYRRPMSSNNRSKPSILNKLKSFFTNDGNDGKEENSGLKRRHLASGGSPTVSIPGGFFNSDDASPSIVLPKCPGEAQISNSTPNVDAINEGERDEEASADEEPYNADISNAKLADFFSRKGGEPLSEMEMEGVKSLMKKSSKSVRSSRAGSIVNTTLSHDDPTDLVYSRILKHSRTPSLATSTMRAPAFTPRYDDSFGSHSFANTSRGSVSSRRRVFDYSSLPSPYKTTVYKYSAADNDSSDAHGTKTPDASKSMVVKPSNGKKLSNTASALVSLLENDNSKEETSNRLANPYSSHVNQLRKYKKSLPTLPATKQEPSKFAPIKSSALQELENAKTKVTNEVAPKSQQHNSVDKYKPMRSSSLRSNVVKADESPERKITTKETEPEVPKAPTFNFQFQTNDKIEPNTKSQPHAHPAAKPEFAFKFQPQKFGPPDNNSDSDVVDKIPTKVANAYSTAPSIIATESDPEYDFGQISPSNIDPSAVDNKKVQDFKTLFVF